MSAILSTLTFAPSVAHADAPPTPAAPVRILLAGDSITLGRHSDYTWRYRLDKELHRQHVAFDFVGDSTTPFVDAGYSSAKYADPNFDHNFYARAGHGFGPFRQPDRDLSSAVVAQVSKYQPDVVVIELGAADLLYSLFDPTNNDARTSESPQQAADHVADRLRTFIANVRAAQPNIRIVVPNVLTMDQAVPSRNGPMNEAVTLYNSEENQVASDLTQPGVSEVDVARTMDYWNPTSGLSVDGLHLSPTGETLYAQRIAETLHNVGILPQAPHMYHVVPWTYTLQPRVVLRGHRATLSWSRQILSGAYVHVHQARHAGRTMGSYTTGDASYRVSPGATYTFTLRLVRWRLTGPWGPSVTIHIPKSRKRR